MDIIVSIDKHLYFRFILEVNDCVQNKPPNIPFPMMQAILTELLRNCTSFHYKYLRNPCSIKREKKI